MARRLNRVVLWWFGALTLGFGSFLLSFPQRRAHVFLCTVPDHEESVDGLLCHGLKDPNAPMVKPLPSFLWGIPTLEKDVKRRQTIRETYLTAFQNSTTPNRICPLFNYQPGCQVAYIFFAGGNPSGPTELLDPNASFPLTISKHNSGEDDVVYFNIKENQMGGKMTTFFRYAAGFSQFDYIAKVDDDTLIFPQNLLDYFYKHLPAKPHRVHGGLAMDASSCDPTIQEDHSCPLPLVGDVYISGEFSFMSRDLAEYITDTNRLPYQRRWEITIQSHEDVSLSNYVFSIEDPVQVLKIPKNRILRNERQLADWHWATHPYRGTLWAHSTRKSGGYYKSLATFRQVWKIFMLSAESNFIKLPQTPRITCQSNAVFQWFNAANATTRPTFLWGIPSNMEDTERRAAIRETYLSYFQYSEEPNRVCPLSWYTDECQIAYAFFVVANPEEPPELLDASASLTVAKAPKSKENDVLYLNVRENQTHGQVMAWFQYAAKFSQFEYIAKVEGDTFVFLPNFLDFVQANVTKTPTRVFGGVPYYADNCDRKSRKEGNVCPLPLVGNAYMSGEFIFMSNDLAVYMTEHLSSARRKNMTLASREDVSISNYVFSHPDAVDVVFIPKAKILRQWKLNAQYSWLEHPYAETLWAYSSGFDSHFFRPISRFRRTWREYLVYLCSKKRRSPYTKFELFDAPIASSDDLDALEADDFIYTYKPVSPVVMESHELVFFPIPGAGDVSWKQLFRRMMGYEDWQTNPSRLEDDGLKYLYHYSPDEARKIMQEYTVAMMVRDPKQRLYDAFEKYKRDFFIEHCCPHARSARTQCEMRSNMLKTWAEDAHMCDLPQWRPQGEWMDPKYYEQLGFVLHFETAEHDAKLFLARLGLWQKYGSSGWGGGGAIFNNKTDDMVKAQELRKQMARGFRAEFESWVEYWYKADYQSDYLDIRNWRIQS